MLDRIIDEKWLTARGIAGLWPCARDGDDIIVHVEADPALRGTGAAGRLMTAIVALAREKKLQIVPRCAYAVAWFKRYPDAADVLA